jgi:hypothetical protein
MHEAGDDLIVLEAMVEAMPRFLASSELTRVVLVRLAGRLERPAMSLGRVLELLHELEFRARDGAAESVSTPDLSDRLARLRAQIAAARLMEREGHARHLQREIKSGVEAWQWFLESCQPAGPECRESLEAEVRRRARLVFLASEAQAAKADAFPEALRRRLEQLDARFEELSDPGPFLGREGEAGAYPEPRFPWLYRALRG